MSSSQVLSLPPVVAPTKVLIVPLSAKEEFNPLIQEVCTSFSLVKHGGFSTVWGHSVEAAQGGDLLTGGRFQHLYRQAIRTQ